MSDHRDYIRQAQEALDEAKKTIDDVGSLRQDEFLFYWYLTTALVLSLAAIASARDDAGGAIN